MADPSRTGLALPTLQHLAWAEQRELLVRTPVKMLSEDLSLNGPKAMIEARFRLGRLPIVAEANAEDSRFASESTFRPLHRFGDLRDRCSGLRMGFEFLNVFFRPRTAMRCRFLRGHEQYPQCSSE